MTGSDIARTGARATGGGGADLVRVAGQVGQIRELGETLIASGLLPDHVRKPETAVAIMLKGQELGIGAMYALSHVVIIKGKPALSAELMAALVQRAGHTLRVVEMSRKGCIVEGIRGDDPSHRLRVSFDEEDARAAGLLNQPNYKKYPQDLYRSRAISRLGRSMFQDAIMGASYTPEELGADVDAEGQVVQVAPAPLREVKPDPAKAALGEDGLMDWERDQQAEAPEEAEVVEEAAGAPEGEVPDEEERGDVLPSQVARIENLSEWIWGDKRAVEEKVLKGHRIEELSKEAAPGVIAGLQRTKERIRAGEETDERAEVPPGNAPHPDEVAGVERGGASRLASGGDVGAAASREQIERLKALLFEIDGDIDGVGALEETAGKSLEEFTAEDAEEWIGRLRGERS